MKKIITASALAVGLALCLPFALAKEKKHEEENISKSDVPAAVQKAADTEAKGGKIVRWEKEGANYEVVIEKSGKEWGVKIDAAGKVLSKHEESKEKEENEKNEKH
jgi:plastocyanin